MNKMLDGSATIKTRIPPNFQESQLHIRESKSTQKTTKSNNNIPEQQSAIHIRIKRVYFIILTLKDSNIDMNRTTQNVDSKMNNSSMPVTITVPLGSLSVRHTPTYVVILNIYNTIDNKSKYLIVRIF